MNPKHKTTYKLHLLTKQHIYDLYHWTIEEKQFEYYTCRPVKSCNSLDEYTTSTLKLICDTPTRIYVLVDKTKPSIPLGKIILFDINPRNHSAEFGYYLPSHTRSQGLGSLMVAQFIETIFKDDILDLNKLYATTASNNIASIKLLEKFNFKLDGRLREHYWIGENKYDQLVYSLLKQEYVLNNYSILKSN